MTPHLSAASRWHTHTLHAGLVLAAAFLLLCGCGERQAPPDVHGPLLQAAPASGGVSAATEHAIADEANAKATRNKPAAKAATVAINEQEKAEVRSSLHPFYWLSALAFVVAAILAYEGNLKFAVPVALGGVAAPVAAAFVAWVSDHREIVLALGGIGAVGALVWHYRARAKVDALALEHAIGHAVKGGADWMMTHHPVHAVTSVLHEAWIAAEADAKAIALKLHFVKSEPVAPSVPVAPATVTMTQGSKPVVEAPKP